MPYFLILLLFMSIHACGGRQLGAVVQENFVKDVKKVEIGHVSMSATVLVQSNSKEVMLKDEELARKIGASLDGANHVQKSKDLEAAGQKEMERVIGRISGFIRIKSLATVSSWIPRGKHGDHSVYNSDYSPPKTHPPSHY